VETNTLKKMKEEGKAEGRVEGKAEGRVEGEAELIKIMLNNGINIDIISKQIGLSIDEIKKLLS